MAANAGKHKLEHTLSLPIVNFPKIEDLKLAGVNVKPRQWHDLMIPLHDLVGTMPGLEVEAAGMPSCWFSSHWLPFFLKISLNDDVVVVNMSMQALV